MKPTTAVLIIPSLSSKPLEFVTIELDQCFNDHHRAKIVIDMQYIGENVFASPMKKTSLVNDKAIIYIQEGKDEVNAYTFSGIITDVQVELDKGDHGLLHVYAASPTICLERGRMMQTYSDTDLELIVGEVTAGVQFSVIKKPKYKQDIKFSMQYKETDFQYLRRLAWMYGEKFYYTGEDLVFGEFGSPKTVKVTYGHDLTEVKFGAKLVANTVQQYYHDVDFTKSPYEHPLSRPGTFAGEANGKSSYLNLGRKPDLPMDVPVWDDGSLQELTKMRKERNYTDMFHVTGETRVYRVCIGGLLEINFHSKMKVDDVPGTLRIIRVKHVFDANGRYHNEFDAVPAEFERIPCPDMDFPVASALPAKVVANEDPDGLGKIQLKFDFDKLDCEYWMPLMQPEAGKGEGLNRGYSFIPELNDMVLVSFFDGNPEFPFVMGSMFHGKNAAGLGGGKGNHIKSITDKTEGQILMNTDKKGAWGVTVRDQKGDLFQIDTRGENIVITANKNVTISAGETMTLNCKNMIVNVEESQQNFIGENMATSVGKNQQTAVTETFEITSKNMEETYIEDVNTTVGEKQTTTSGESELFTTKGNVVIKSASKALVQGAKDARISKG